MSERGKTFLLAAGAGLIAGMRSMTLPAFLNHYLKRRDGGVANLLARSAATPLLRLLATGELIADKTPFVPDRTEPPSLAGRAIVGGLCGVAIAERRNGARLGAALLGSAAAVGSTFLSYELRKRISEGSRLPDPVWGLAEDMLVILAASRLVAAADG